MEIPKNSKINKPATVSIYRYGAARRTCKNDNLWTLSRRRRRRRWRRQRSLACPKSPFTGSREPSRKTDGERSGVFRLRGADRHRNSKKNKKRSKPITVYLPRTRDTARSLTVPAGQLQTDGGNRVGA